MRCGVAGFNIRNYKAFTGISSPNEGSPTIFSTHLIWMVVLGGVYVENP
jgi:hypothetical protein